MLLIPIALPPSALSTQMHGFAQLVFALVAFDLSHLIDCLHRERYLLCKQMGRQPSKPTASSLQQLLPCAVDDKLLASTQGVAFPWTVLESAQRQPCIPNQQNEDAMEPLHWQVKGMAVIMHVLLQAQDMLSVHAPAYLDQVSYLIAVILLGDAHSPMLREYALQAFCAVGKRPFLCPWFCPHSWAGDFQHIQAIEGIFIPQWAVLDYRQDVLGSDLRGEHPIGLP